MAGPRGECHAAATPVASSDTFRNRVRADSRPGPTPRPVARSTPPWRQGTSRTGTPRSTEDGPVLRTPVSSDETRRRPPTQGQSGVSARVAATAVGMALARPVCVVPAPSVGTFGPTGRSGQ